MRETSRAREASDDQGFDSRFDVAFQPGFEEKAAALDEFDPFGLGSSADHEFGRLEGVNGVADAVPPAAVRYIDRFLIAIWIAGIALIFFGIGGMSLGASSYYGTEGGGPDYFSIIAMQFSPYLILLGLGTLIGSIFLLASRSDRRSGRRADRRSAERAEGHS